MRILKVIMANEGVEQTILQLAGQYDTNVRERVLVVPDVCDREIFSYLHDIAAECFSGAEQHLLDLEHHCDEHDNIRPVIMDVELYRGLVLQRNVTLIDAYQLVIEYFASVQNSLTLLKEDLPNWAHDIDLIAKPVHTAQLRARHAYNPKAAKAPIGPSGLLQIGFEAPREQLADLQKRAYQHAYGSLQLVQL